MPTVPGSESPPTALADLGRRLRARGLNERALRHCFGVTCAIHAPLRALAARAPDPLAPVSVPPAALLAHLFVAGSAVPADPAARLLGADLDRLAELGLVRVDADVVIAARTVLPVGEALVVTDRADRMRGPDVVACADDSAMHTIGMVPARAARPGLRWLDVGTGAAIVPLARPGAAARVRATDMHARALELARLGVALSGRDIELRVADLLDGAERDGPWDLITFNAPIPASVVPAPGDVPLYRRGADDILERFWRDARALVTPAESPAQAPAESPAQAPAESPAQAPAESPAHAPAAAHAQAPAEATPEVIVHSWQPLTGYPASLALPGRVVALRYTPPGQEPAFGVTVWHPHAPPAAHLVHVTLAPEAPHLTRAALALAP